MTYLIKKWFLPNEMKEEYNADVLDNLSKVNIFIGPNNSGKSWFMRKLIALPKEMISPTEFDLDYLLYIIGDIRDKFKTHLNLQPVKNFNKLFSNLYDDNLVPQKYIETNKNHPININTFVNSLKEYKLLKFGKSMDYNERDFVFRSISDLSEYLSKYIDELNNIKSYFREEYKFYKIYIPVLRGLRGIEGDINRNFYKDRTFRDYFSANKIPKNPDIFTGLEMYERVDNLGRGNEDERTIKKDYEQLLSKYFFEGKKIELTSRISKDVVYVKIGNEKEYPIYELGDGIQQLIIITFPLFDNKDKDVLAFIEEPELYLHPGLQRTLLELLSSNEFGNLQTFVTTHSNHFLDMTLDFDKISVYRFSKEIQEDENNETKINFYIENTSNENLNLLECLGVKNSSVMLTNCTIWVEGITDRMYIRKYLEVYQEHLKEDANTKIFEEDKHYSFVEYSGNNITHWSFLDDDSEDESQTGINEKKLCSILFLLADKDDEKSKAKNERHKKLKEKLGDERYHRLNCREIENLLSPKVLKVTVEEIDKITIEDKINYKDYKSKPVGEYIDTILKRKSTKSYRASKTSGSLNSNLKSKFAKIAISHIKDIDDFTAEAKEICDKLYNFIESNNS